MEDINNGTTTSAVFHTVFWLPKCPSFYLKSLGEWKVIFFMKFESSFLVSYGSYSTDIHDQNEYLSFYAL